MTSYQPAALLLLGLAPILCPLALRAQALDGPPRDLPRAAAEHYHAYGQALAQGERSLIASFYDPAGALIIFNGSARRSSRAELDARYRGAWQPPAYFAWDSLAYTPLAPDLVLVTGGFRWLRQGQSDTTHFQYTAILATVDSGLAIRFEQETAWPR